MLKTQPTELIVTIDSLVQAQHIETAWDVLVEEMARFGFDRLFYGYTRFNTVHGFGRPNDFLILSNCSENYINGFLQQEMYRYGPMVQWAGSNTGAMSWSWIADRMHTFNEDELRVVEFNQKHQITTGYTISFSDTSSRNKGAIALCGRKGLTQNDVENIWASHGQEIELLNEVAHLKFKSLPLPKANSKLSIRQREVLEWAGDGKTMQDIADILCLRTATVEKHLKNARAVLGVETTAQAVRKASVMNQIYILQSPNWTTSK